MAAEPKPKEPMTYEEFLAWADEDTYAEWVGGEVIMLSPASLVHQDVGGFLEMLMRVFVERYDLGKVVNAPFQMRLRKVERGREPDILFVAKNNLSRLTDTYLDGPADLVVEIVSEESTLLDRGEKYAEYEIEGVKEYWLIDPDNKRADFFVLDREGRYERRHPDAEGNYRSIVLEGFWLNVNWLWQTPLPSLMSVLKELGLV